MSVFDSVVSTLNASTGPIVTVAHLEAALRAGSLDAIENNSARASVSYLFVELMHQLRLIALCCYAIDVPITQANQLYLHTVAEGIPRVREWEEAMENLI